MTSPPMRTSEGTFTIFAFARLFPTRISIELPSKSVLTTSPVKTSGKGFDDFSNSRPRADAPIADVTTAADRGPRHGSDAR
jgi:hypothetical protein